MLERLYIGILNKNLKKKLKFNNVTIMHKYVEFMLFRMYMRVDCCFVTPSCESLHEC